MPYYSKLPLTFRDFNKDNLAVAGGIGGPDGPVPVDHLVNASDLDELMMALKMKISARTM